jgi:hypothetical protein
MLRKIMLVTVQVGIDWTRIGDNYKALLGWTME